MYIHFKSSNQNQIKSILNHHSKFLTLNDSQFNNNNCHLLCFFFFNFQKYGILISKYRLLNELYIHVKCFKNQSHTIINIFR